MIVKGTYSVFHVLELISTRCWQHMRTLLLTNVKIKMKMCFESFFPNFIGHTIFFSHPSHQIILDLLFSYATFSFVRESSLFTVHWLIHTKWQLAKCKHPLLFSHLGESSESADRSQRGWLLQIAHLSIWDKSTLFSTSWLEDDKQYRLAYIKFD